MFFTLQMPKNIPVEEQSAAWEIKVGLAFTLAFSDPQDSVAGYPSRPQV